jgi:hypothetical protein
VKTIEALSDNNRIPKLDRYYYKDIESILNIKRSAINVRKRAAKIQPHADENSLEAYLDSEQMLELQKCHEFMERGGISSNYRGKYNEPDALADATRLNTADKYDSDFPAILDMEIIRRNALDAIACNERIQTYALFEIYSRSQETLTDKEIERLIGFKPPRTGFKYERYKFVRYSHIHVLSKETLKPVKMATWLIEKFDPLEQRREKLHAAKAFVEQEAIANFKAVKEMLKD